MNRRFRSTIGEAPRIVLVALLCLLQACSEPESVESPVEASDHAVPEDRAADSAPPTPGLLAEPRYAETRAELLAMASDGSEVTVDHGPLHAIGMGSMTMAFDVADGVSLPVFPAGTKLEIRIRQNRDYTYELVAACETADSGAQSVADNDPESGASCLPD